VKHVGRFAGCCSGHFPVKVVFFPSLENFQLFLVRFAFMEKSVTGRLSFPCNPLEPPNEQVVEKQPSRPPSSKAAVCGVALLRSVGLSAGATIWLFLNNTVFDNQYSSDCAWAKRLKLQGTH